VQVARDLAGFSRGTYAAVREDMRGWAISQALLARKSPGGGTDTGCTAADVMQFIAPEKSTGFQIMFGKDLGLYLSRSPGECRTLRTMLLAILLAALPLRHPSAHASTLSGQVADAVDHHYLYADSDGWKALRPGLLAQSATTTASLDQQLLQLHDSDLHLITTDQMAMLRAETAGDERGIGLVDFAVTIDPNTGRSQVVTPLLDSPAFRSGLEPRDIILSINGKSTTGLTHEDVMALLRSDVGTLRLIVSRDGHERSIDVPTSTWKQEAVAARDLEAGGKHLGYVSVRLFTADSGEKVRKAAESLAARGVDRCILDLRNNPGGYLDAMAAAGSAFTDQVLGWMVHRDGTRDPIHSSSPVTQRMQLAVLVNEGTASAAEILAAGLREAVGARLVGSQTFGRGQIQTYIALNSDTGILIPVANAQTPKGAQFNRRSGLHPDIAASSSPQSGASDAAYLKAVELLTRG